MAKKNLASLMSGLIGETEPEPDYAANGGGDPASEKKRRRPGRPRKEAVEAEEVRATFIVNAEFIRKMKYICLVDNCLQKDILAGALNEYIERWEATNGKIKLPQK